MKKLETKEGNWKKNALLIINFTYQTYQTGEVYPEAICDNRPVFSCSHYWARPPIPTQNTPFTRALYI